MKITRNGIEYELTSQELRNAFCEQQHLNDISDIDFYLACHLSEDDVKKVKDDKEFFDDAAYALRSNLDELDMGFDAAIAKAIEYAYDEFNAREGY